MNNLEYKVLEFKKENFNNSDPDFYHFEGYASTFGNEDLGGDVVMPGAFTDSLKLMKPKMVYQHDMKNVIGVWDKLKEDSNGLWGKGRLPKKNRMSNDVGVLMECGAIDSLSIGYQIDKYSISDNKKLLEKLSLYEISPVTIPMNPAAKIMDVKAVTPFKDLPLAPRDTKWDSNAAIGRVRKFTDSEDAPSATYKNAFMWHDKAEGDKFGSYKLPYVDVINGKLMAVPQAIISIAGVLNGARGGADIPEAEQEKIKEIVKKYYSKMDMEPPFDDKEKSFITIVETKSIDDFSTLKDFEAFLKDPVPLSNRERRFFISKFKSIIGQCDVDYSSENESVECDVSFDSEVKKSIEALDLLNTKLKTLLSGDPK